MIDNWPILSIITFMPLAGVLFLLMFVGMMTPLPIIHEMLRYGYLHLPFGLLVILIGFDSGASGYQFEEQRVWLGDTGISYHMGVDGISMPFVLHTPFDAASYFGQLAQHR